MRHPQQFRLSSRGLLFAAVSVALSQTSQANTGRVDFASGNITVTGSDGAARRLVKGNEVKTGDRIVSDGSGRAQIRFSDGSFVSLQPNTDFDIKTYVFNGRTDGSEKAIFGLLKGAMRTVTGLVGRVNRDAYQINTPTATVGIRGTGGLIYIAPDGSTWILSSSGVWTMTNPAGSVEVPAGTAATSGSDGKKSPERTDKLPIYTPPTTEEKKTNYAQGESRSNSGSQSDVPTFKPLVTGSGYAVAYAGAEGGSLRMGIPRNATFSSLGQMTAFVSSTDAPAQYTLNGSHAEFSTTEGILAWGRWTGTVDQPCCSQATFNSNQGLHYVVGIPTPAASLPTGLGFTYNMIGATSPTTINGGVAPGTLTSATLSGNFLSNVVSASFAGNIGGRSFNATANNMNLTTATASFSGNGNYTGTLAGCCASASVSGFFSGSGASHAGFVYQLNNTSLGSAVTGAAALSKGAQFTPIDMR